MATKKVEVDERVLAIQTQMDEKVAEVHQVEQEQAELQALLDARIQQLKDSFQGKVDILSNRKEYLITEIRALFDQVPHKETETLAKVTLLSGDVVVKKPKLDFDYDKKLLLEHAEKNGMKEYVKTNVTHDFNWAGLKKVLEIQEDGSIVNVKTGGVLEIQGLKVLPVAEQVVIK